MTDRNPNPSMSDELTQQQCKMIATYIQRISLELKKIKTEKEIEKMPNSLGLFWMNVDTPLDLLNRVVYNAMERKNMICSYDDSKLPHEKIGRCEYENHYENAEEDIALTEEEQDQFDKINEEKGWWEAVHHFDNKFNPKDQKLQLVLDYDDDTHKLFPDRGEYVCEKCMEEIKDNSDGYVACDMEDYEE